MRAHHHISFRKHLGVVMTNLLGSYFAYYMYVQLFTCWFEFTYK